MGYGSWKDFNDCALRMLWNENAVYARQGRSKRVDYRDCVKVLLVHLYNHNKTWFSAAGVSRFHRNLIAYSFLTMSKKIGAMFRNFKVGGKTQAREQRCFGETMFGHWARNCNGVFVQAY